MKVTGEQAVARFGDPDIKPSHVRGAIAENQPGSSRIGPYPRPSHHNGTLKVTHKVRRSKARAGSLVAELAGSGRAAGESNSEH